MLENNDAPTIGKAPMIELESFLLNGSVHDSPLNLSAKNLSCILGLNGAGKSTLLRAIAGIHNDYKGRILFEGHPLEESHRKRARKLAWCPDKMEIPSSFRVMDILILGRYPIHEGYPSKSDHLACLKLLADLDSENLADKLITEISAGEWQKVMVARTLAQETPFILLDEPTAHLDLKAAQKMMSVLKKASESKTILVAMHDIRMAWHFSDQVWLMNQLSIVAHGPTKKTMTESLLEQLYGTKIEIHPKLGPLASYESIY
jgi:ABC-type cobalamin/Fe3+-siderophores transport system ATPase subunit